jgi:hypothetical protein
LLQRAQVFKRVGHAILHYKKLVADIKDGIASDSAGTSLHAQAHRKGGQSFALMLTTS